MARGEKERAKVRVEIEVIRYDGYLTRQLIDVGLGETVEPDDVRVDHKIHELAEEAINRATMQTATVFEKPVEEPEEVSVDE